MSIFMKKYSLFFFCLLALCYRLAAQESVPLPPVEVDEYETEEYDDFEKEGKPLYQNNTKEYKQEYIQEQAFDKSAWEKAKDGLDYTVEKPVEKPQEDVKKDQKPQKNNDISPQAISQLGTFFKWFFLIIGISVLAYIIFKFLSEGDFQKNKRINVNSQKIDLDEIEENLHETDIDPHITRAIAQKEWSLAIRLYYLAIIKELSLSKAIVWERDKTNRRYVNEMQQHRHFEPFRSLTRIFERVWYGENTVNETQFNDIKPNFQQLLNTLRQK